MDICFSPISSTASQLCREAVCLSYLSFIASTSLRLTILFAGRKPDVADTATLIANTSRSRRAPKLGSVMLSPAMRKALLINVFTARTAAAEIFKKNLKTSLQNAGYLI